MTSMSGGSRSFLERRKREIVDEGEVTVPLIYDELKAEAEQTLAAPQYEYVTGGVGGERTMRANRDGFRQWRIVPRILRDVSVRRLRTELLSETLDAPVCLSPVGRQARFDERGELASILARVL